MHATWVRGNDVRRGNGTKVRSTLCLLTVAVLLLAGCSDTGDSASGEQPETLQEYFGVGMDQDEMMAQAEAQQREMEQAVADCMADEGFEYVPREFGDMMGADDPRQELSEAEFREEYGYGVSTVDRSEMSAAQPDDDPNFEIQQEMDEAEQQAYQRALHGEMPEFDPDDDPEDQVFEPGGCQGEAMQDVQGERTEVMRELEPAMMELQERIGSDPRMVEAEQTWQACLSEAGYDFTDRFDPQNHIHERFNELQQAAHEQMDPQEFDPEDGPPEIDIDPEALEELQQEELELAEVEGECTSEHLTDVEQEVRAEHEGAFIDQHREQLEEVRPGD